MLNVRFLPLCLLLGIALVGASPSLGIAEDDADDSKNFAQRMLEGLTVGDPVVTDQLFVFPLLAPVDAEETPVVAEPDADAVNFGEPEFVRRRYDVLVQNGGDQPVLVLGGVVLDGGKRDRLIRRSVLVGAHAEVEAAALPASASTDIRKEAEPFGVAEALAPTYLRKKGLFGGSPLTTTTFIVRWLDFREEDDERKSLVAIAESPKLKQFCLPCHQSMSSMAQPEVKGMRVVGAIGGVRGRIQGLVLFGNNKLLRAYFEGFLKGATYPAAAIELKAKKVGVKLPGKEDPEATTAILAEEARELVKHLAKARYYKDRVEDGEVGEALLFRAPGATRGRAIGLDGKLVYLAAFPHDPFESALYGSTVDWKDPELLEDPGRAGVAELARREGRGFRLTAAEQRLLDRLRTGLGPNTSRPGGAANPGGALPGRRR